MQTVSHSEAEAYALCKRKHFYTYGLKIQKRSSSGISISLYWGIIGHRCLAWYYEAKKNKHAEPMDYVWEQVQKDYSVNGYKNLILMQEIIDRLQRYADHYENDGWQVIEIESSSHLTLVEDELQTQIRPDLVVRIPGKGIVVVDHKFVYDFQPQIVLEIAPQLPKYIAGKRSAGMNIVGGMFNEIRYRNIKNPTDDQLFKRPPIELTRHRTLVTLQEHAQISGEIYGLKTDMTIEEWESRTYRTGNKMICNSCGFQDICINDIHGRLRHLMMTQYYEPRSEHKVEIPPTEGE